MLNFLVLAGVASAKSAFNGEDGYRLWMKYDGLNNSQKSQQYKGYLQHIDLRSKSKTADIIQQELQLAATGLLNIQPTFKSSKAKLVIASKSQLQDTEHWLLPSLKKVGDEGYVINNHDGAIFISANTDIGLLYGTFHFIRLMQKLQAIDSLSIVQTPKVKLRMLNHWDDLNRHTERGYAGQSIFDWHKLPDYKEQRYYDYARANASIGINGIVPINVNSDSLILTPKYLEKVKALADIFRPYGIKVYLSLKFSSPQQLDGLSTSDPLNKEVQQWRQQKNQPNLSSHS